MSITRSESLAALATALVKAQAKIEGASKDSVNPHFKSKYADLASVWEACRVPLTANNLSVLQPVSADGPRVTVTTILLHASGEYLSESLTLTAQQDTPQAVGSAITYGRRYGLAAMVGIAPEDDDGEAAQGRASVMTKAVVLAAPKGFDEWLSDLAAVAEEGTDRLHAAWKVSKVEYRQHLTTTYPKNWDALKAIAARANDRVPA